MARNKRQIISGTPHHVILRGNNRRRLFTNTTDYLRLLKYLHEAIRRTGCQLHAICIMTNHMHLLLTPLEHGALSMCVKHSAQKYAQDRNRRRGGTGKLFEQTFFSRPVLDEIQMAVTMVYVEVNAWRAGIVGDPADHEWSSYSVHAGIPGRGRIPPCILTPSKWYAELGDDPASRAREYIQIAGTLYLRGATPEDACNDVDRIEKRYSKQYDRRLLRPDGTRAA